MGRSPFSKDDLIRLRLFLIQILERPLRSVAVRHRAPEGHREGEGTDFIERCHAEGSAHRPENDAATQRRHRRRERRQRSKRHLCEVGINNFSPIFSIAFILSQDRYDALFFKKWAIPSLFFFISVFSIHS